MARVLTGFISYSLDFFFLQIRKKALSSCIIMTVTTSTHTGFHIQRFKQLFALLLVYCEPWSECNMTLWPGLRRQ
jgi:hypothetical protein